MLKYLDTVLNLKSIVFSLKCTIILILIGDCFIGHVARMEEGWSAFKMLTGKRTGKRRLGRPRRRWEDNIRMDLKEIKINTREWVDSAHNRDYWRALANATLNLRVPWAMELDREKTGFGSSRGEIILFIAHAISSHGNKKSPTANY